MNRLSIAVLALALVGVSCGTDTTSGESTATTVSPTTVTSSVGSTTTLPVTTSSVPESTTTSIDPGPPATVAPPVTEADLPGEDFDLSPRPDAQLAVIGVAFDDVLNVRSGPGVDNDIIATLEPMSTAFWATGRGRLLPSSIWYEVVTDGGVVGWVSSRFTAQLGDTIDLTSWVIDDLGGEIPTAADMETLGLLVAESQASVDPRSDIVIAQAATVGDLGEIIIDVVGLGDDAVSGIRLHIFAEPFDGGFSLKAVESTSLCVTYRGVTEDRFCV